MVSGRKLGGQPGHSGSLPVLLPIERGDEVVHHRPDPYSRCVMSFKGEDSDPLPNQLIEIPPIAPLVIEHRVHWLIYLLLHQHLRAVPSDVEVSRYGPRISFLVGLLGNAFPFSVSMTMELLHHLGAEISCGGIIEIRRRLTASLEHRVLRAMAFARRQAELC